MDRRAIIALLGVFGGWAPQAPSADWPGYLGEDGRARWDAPNVDLDLNDGNPALRWSAPLGGGYSGPSVVGGRVYVMDRIEEAWEPAAVEPGTNLNFVRAVIPGVERVLCLDGDSGERIWRKEYPVTYSSAYPYAIGPRTTPLVHEGTVYTLGAEGDLRAWNAETGDPLWGRQLIEEYGFETPEWGIAAHPIIDGERLIAIVGGEGSAVVAFDRTSGEEVWRALTASKPGYSMPRIAAFGGLRQVLIWTGDGLSGLAPDTGEVYWSVPFEPAYGMAIATPQVVGSQVFLMGFNAKSGLIEVAADGRAARLVWGPSPRLGVAGVFNTPLVREGHIYSGGRRGQFRCVRWEDGALVWEDPAPLLNLEGKGRGAWQSAFTVEHPESGSTIVFNDHGEMIVTRLSTGGYEEASRVPLIAPTHRVSGRMLVWSHPALSGRRVYLRNDEEIRCWELGLRGGEDVERN